MARGGKRGAKPVTARDWIFGSRPRRLLLLRCALSADVSEKGWTKAEIARRCELSPHGGADEHINGAVALGLLVERDGRYWPSSPMGKLASSIGDLLTQLDAVPECSLEELLRLRRPERSPVTPPSAAWSSRPRSRER